MRGVCVQQGVSEGSDPGDLEQDQERKQREIFPLWGFILGWVGLVSQCLGMQGVGCGIIVYRLSFVGFVLSFLFSVLSWLTTWIKVYSP